MTAAQRVIDSPELVGIISETLSRQNVGHLRAVCRDAERSTWYTFKKYLKVKKLSFTETGLQDLWHISRDERFARELRTIKIYHETHDFTHIDEPFRREMFPT